MSRKITRTCTSVALLMLGYLGLVACDAPTPTSSKIKTALSETSADALPANCNDEEEEAAAAFRLVGEEKANYNEDVGKLITNKCATAGCHVAGGPTPELTNYQQSKDAGIDILDRAVSQANMPNQNGGGPLNDAEKELLQEWADLGYPELFVATPVADDEVAGDPAAATEEKGDFAAASAAVSSCTSCHNTADATAGLDLESREGFVAGMEKIIPKVEGGHYSLTDDEKATIQIFITAVTGKEADKEDECKVPVVTEIEKSSFSKSLTPAKMTECKEAGTLYDRSAKQCHEATSGSRFTCDWDGVGRAYRGTGATEELGKIKDDGFQVDQCGEHKKAPVFMLIKMNDSSGKMEFEYKILSLSK